MLNNQNGQKQTLEAIEVRNRERIRTFKDKEEDSKNLWKLVADTIERRKINYKVRKKCHRRMKKISQNQTLQFKSHQSYIQLGSGAL